MNRKDLMKLKNVVGHGKSRKIKNGVMTDVPSITVFVRKKVPLDQLAKEDIVPDTIDGIKTDVIEIGKVRALANVDKMRPAPGGVSIGHYAITAGTLGVVVKSKMDGKRMILSNNHVLANSNDAVLGDAILQPGVYDGGTIANDKIGTLHNFVPISFYNAPAPPTPPPPTPPPTPDPGSSCPIANAMRAMVNAMAKVVGSKWRVKEYDTKASVSAPVTLKVTIVAAVNNRIDYALAMPDSDSFVSDDILEIGKPVGVNSSVTIGMDIQKSGRTTGYTKGKIIAVDTTIDVLYGTNMNAIFEGQIMSSVMSQGGDSGSLILDMNKNAVGLLFAGSDTATIMNPIQEVLEGLKYISMKKIVLFIVVMFIIGLLGGCATVKQNKFNIGGDILTVPESVPSFGTWKGVPILIRNDNDLFAMAGWKGINPHDKKEFVFLFTGVEYPREKNPTSYFIAIIDGFLIDEKAVEIKNYKMYIDKSYWKDGTYTGIFSETKKFPATKIFVEMMINKLKLKPNKL